MILGGMGDAHTTQNHYMHATTRQLSVLAAQAHGEEDRFDCPPRYLCYALCKSRQTFCLTALLAIAQSGSIPLLQIALIPQPLFDQFRTCFSQNWEKGSKTSKFLSQAWELCITQKSPDLLPYNLSKGYSESSFLN